MYEQIIFFDDEGAEELIETYKQRGWWIVMDAIKRWHHPGEHEVTENSSRGTSDTWFKRDGYRLIINEAAGYVALEYEL